MPTHSSKLHTMAALQVYQVKLLHNIDKPGPDPAMFKELRSATDLAQRAAIATAQAISHTMASLEVLERHL